MIQFLSAVDHMHDKWYIHRDLKTTNLLYQNGVLCLCDFGLARKYGRCRIFLKRILCSYSTHYRYMQLNNTSCSYFAVSFYFIVNGTTLTLLLAPRFPLPTVSVPSPLTHSKWSPSGVSTDLNPHTCITTLVMFPPSCSQKNDSVLFIIAIILP